MLAQSYVVLVRKSNSPGLKVVTNITHKNDEQLICITTEKNARMLKYCLECSERASLCSHSSHPFLIMVIVSHVIKCLMCHSCTLGKNGRNCLAETSAMSWAVNSSFESG